MADFNVVVPGNLSPVDFSLGGEVANLVTIALGAGLVRPTPADPWQVDMTAIAAATTNTLELTGNTLTSTVNGVAATQDLSALAAGTGNAVTAVSRDPATGLWTFTFADNSTQTVSDPLDNVLASSNFDVATNILTLTLSDGSNIPVDLTDLVDAYSLTAGDGIAVSGDGSTATPWEVSVVADPDPTNTLTVGPNGVLVPPSPAVVSTDALQTAKLGTDFEIYAMPSVTKEYCAGGAVDNLAQADLTTSIAAAFNINYAPQNSHSTSEIEFLLFSGVASPADYGFLEVRDLTNGGVLVGTSTNSVSIPTANTELPFTFTFSPAISFVQGVDYRIDFSVGGSTFGSRRLTAFDPCFPVDVNGVETPAIRIENGSAKYKVLVSEYFNADGTTNKYIAKNECTGDVTEVAALDPSWGECDSSPPSDEPEIQTLFNGLVDAPPADCVSNPSELCSGDTVTFELFACNEDAEGTTADATAVGGEVDQPAFLIRNDQGVALYWSAEGLINQVLYFTGIPDGTVLNMIGGTFADGTTAHTKNGADPYALPVGQAGSHTINWTTTLPEVKLFVSIDCGANVSVGTTVVSTQFYREPNQFGGADEIYSVIRYADGSLFAYNVDTPDSPVPVDNFDAIPSEWAAIEQGVVESSGIDYTSVETGFYRDLTFEVDSTTDGPQAITFPIPFSEAPNRWDIQISVSQDNGAGSASVVNGSISSTGMSIDRVDALDNNQNPFLLVRVRGKK